MHWSLVFKFEDQGIISNLDECFKQQDIDKDDESQKRNAAHSRNPRFPIWIWCLNYRRFSRNAFFVHRSNLNFPSKYLCHGPGLFTFNELHTYVMQAIGILA
jgi:hypothetical protein